MNERNWMNGLTARSRAVGLLLALGALASLAGCGPTTSLSKGQKLLLEPAWTAQRAGDYEKALSVYRRAAEGGLPVAQYQLALLYDKGQGTAPDPAQAVRWYRAAAEAGYPRAQAALARMYEKGRGVDQDEARALVWYRAAAIYERSAEYRLKRPRFPGQALAKAGDMIERGRGTEADPGAAAEYYRSAAELGNPDAYFRLGELYRRGRGVPQDEAKANELYLAALPIYQTRAAAGDIGAQGRLGDFYLYGRGVGKDTDRAVAWLMPAAEGGNTSAFERLGQVFEKGGGTIDANPALAAYYYAQAIARGHGGAGKRLAALYASGDADEDDGAEVLRTFAEKAWHGDGRAAYEVADAFERGVLVDAEPLEALTWYEIASRLGDERAAAGVTRLAERLGSAETSEAMATADAWQQESGAGTTRPASFETGR